ncbi:MAG: hypothetical protein PSX81_11770 [bacterium]|nr:hypothetical protein [bacterium]
MKTCCYYLTLLFVVFTINGCSNEIDVLADYQENAVVYGLLDPSQSIQFIKINKVFTNPNGSATDIAKISDSLYFDTLAPQLVEIETGRILKLYRANVLLKDSGVFANSPNYLYATKQKVYARNPLNSSQILNYRLELTLPSTKRVITAITNLPDSIIVSSPLTVRSQITPSIDFVPGKTFKIIYLSPTNSKISDAYFIFNYEEVNKLDTNIKIKKTIRWRLVNNVRTLDDKGGEQVNTTIASSTFYDLLLANISADANVFRRILLCRMELTVGNIELDNYIQSSEPSIGIVQKQTEYTNIKSGIGIFASRRVTSYNSLQLGSSAKTALYTAIEYRSLGFVK